MTFLWLQASISSEPQWSELWPLFFIPFCLCCHSNYVIQVFLQLCNFLIYFKGSQSLSFRLKQDSVLLCLVFVPRCLCSWWRKTRSSAISRDIHHLASLWRTDSFRKWLFELVICWMSFCGIMVHKMLQMYHFPRECASLRVWRRNSWLNDSDDSFQLLY